MQHRAFLDGQGHRHLARLCPLPEAGLLPLGVPAPETSGELVGGMQSSILRTQERRD